MTPLGFEPSRANTSFSAMEVPKRNGRGKTVDQVSMVSSQGDNVQFINENRRLLKKGREHPWLKVSEYIADKARLVYQ